MPKRQDLKTILLIGSGAIRVGQACEFDYSGTQACLSLKEEGYSVILLNDNPASVMTDYDIADHTYIAPITVASAEAILKKHRPCAILPTMGGQTALNLVLELQSKDLLNRYDVEIIGAAIDAIEKGEDRHLFAQVLLNNSIAVLPSHRALCWQDVNDCISELGFPVIVRTSFSLAGANSILAYDQHELSLFCHRMFSEGAVLNIAPMLKGWKEFEFEVLRDASGNCFSVCCIENIDPMGIHTGDSITVTPSITLDDMMYQTLRKTAFAVIEHIGICGGANVQFALEPATGSFYVIEMNPRVSRSSALASKATSFPIAKVAAKLAVGCTLDEIDECRIEPTLDFFAVKMPKFAFEKFSLMKDHLASYMQSIGEVLAFGKTFAFALLRAMASFDAPIISEIDLSSSSCRIWHVFEALRRGYTIYQVHAATAIDLWFLDQIARIVAQEKKLSLDKESLLTAKRVGFSNLWIARLLHVEEAQVEKKLLEENISPSFHPIEGSAGELSLGRSSWYLSFSSECEVYVEDIPKVLIIGSGPNSIGQGIEFDYSCVHAARALMNIGIAPIVLNCNPETVSTDPTFTYRLYFSPITLEDIMYVVLREKPLGVFIQFGGQLAVNLALSLAKRGVSLIGLSAEVVGICEDRERFYQMLRGLGLPIVKSFICHKGYQVDQQLHFPLVARPSFCIGGSGIRILEDVDAFTSYCQEIYHVGADKVFVEEFLEGAIEYDVDVVSDGKKIIACMISEQIDPVGVHSGDSVSVYPPLLMLGDIEKKIRQSLQKIIKHLHDLVIMNLQVAVKEETVFILELNPRASRSIPFISKASGTDMISLAVQTMMGCKLHHKSYAKTDLFCIKTPYFSEHIFGSTSKGIEMKSTGETMTMTLGRDVTIASLRNQELLSKDILALQQMYSS